MSLKISNNGTEVIKELDRFSKQRFNEIAKDLEVFVSDSVTLMKRNSTKGLNLEGTRFKGYSPSYKAKRAAAGYQTDPVNLTLTGIMLSALTYSIKRATDKIVAEIFFTSTSSLPPKGFGRKGASQEDKARGIEKQGREFFGLSKRRINELRNIFR